MKEKRDKTANVIYYPSGRGGDNVATRICIPMSWFEAMGVTAEDREVRVRMYRGKIIIERVGK